MTNPSVAPLWDVHRFRIAPQTFDTVTRMERAGRVRFLVGKLRSAMATPTGVTLAWRPRGGTEPKALTADRVILATGPDHARITRTVPLLRRMAEAGLVTTDPLGLGLATASEGIAIGQVEPTPGLYVVGPLARGTVGELMGVPEVTAWAEHVARQALRDLAERLPRAVAP
jgi:uncharacterized NAD(P)/FAD-binding protein YdhS